MIPRPFASAPLLRAALVLTVATPVLALTGLAGRLAWAPMADTAPVASAAPADILHAPRFAPPLAPTPDPVFADAADPAPSRPARPLASAAPSPRPPERATLRPEEPAPLPPPASAATPDAPPTAPSAAAAPPGIRPQPRPAAPVPAPRIASLPPRPRPATVARLTPAEPAALIATAPAPLSQTADCPASLTRALPPRAPGAEGGRAALARVADLSGSRRDAALLRMAEGGNIPDHLRRLVPVTLTGTAGDGRRTTITLCVMPDYLALGHDRDFVRVPLGLPAANRIAARFDMILPTATMVDAIHRQARTRLRPAPIPPSARMSSTAYVLRHNAMIEGQRGAAPPGALVSGHKKDLVLTNRLTRVAGRVAIYGWHRADGQPIQPLSTVHGQHYADYSHGVRLVSTTAWVHGRATDLRDLLADRRYAALLTGDEGPIATRQLLAALP